MASNSFGTLFKITTWGESHGPSIGVIIDGCPSGLSISEEKIQEALQRRAALKSPLTSLRKEKERARILSGVFEGKTTGTPISIAIPNTDAYSGAYEPIKDLLRPGHANYTYLQKYGIFDYRGGGRASARETACRVAAGAVAKLLLQQFGIRTAAYLKKVGEIEAEVDTSNFDKLLSDRDASPIFCPIKDSASSMIHLIEQIIQEKDSVGGIVEFCTTALPPGLGDPVYEKLDARLAFALMGLPGTKGIEIGSGFSSSSMKGSQHNDLFINVEKTVCTQTNNAGGILGGISNGMPLIGRVAFKPTSSIGQTMATLTTSQEKALLTLPPESRHDPCIAVRAVPVVEAMVDLVLADAILLNRCSRL